jgi:spore coat-associated protein N
MNRTSPKKRQTRKKIAASAALLLGAASALTISSLAVFTDTENVASNAFSTGSLDLTVGTNTALLTGTDMIPGDRVTSELIVGNSGSVDLRYAMTSSTTGDAPLAADLVLAVKSGVTTCDDAGFLVDGTLLASGTLDSGPAFGDPTQGLDGGDRNILATGNEALCFNVSLPLTSSASGLSVDTTFVFDAEQTANNP